MSADLLRALARGTAMGLMMAGLAVGGGQYGGKDLLFFPLSMFAWMTGFEYWWRRRRRARGGVAVAAAASVPAEGPRLGVVVLTVVFGAALMCGVLAWRGQLRPEAYAIVLVTMVLAAWAAWGFERVARRRDAASAASR